jgi:hypothetical protein
MGAIPGGNIENVPECEKEVSTGFLFKRLEH